MNKYDVRINFHTGSDKIVLEYDEIAFNNIVTNLICNAMKYSPSKGEIDVTLEGDADKVKFTVKDSGCGIPEDEISELFKPFKRFSNVKNIKGTGLGLFIVKQGVDAGGGEILIESKQGEGTTVSVILPKSQPDSTDTQETLTEYQEEAVPNC
jgi:signal transduction histidine kinase